MNMSEAYSLQNNLIHPSKEYSPIPFWFWNDEPNQERIRKQLEDYVDKGVNGLVIHPRIGIPEHIEYLSDAFFDVVSYVVKTAAELYMSILLYDEGMYPSGSAHGKVVLDHPEYGAKGICLRTGNEQSPESPGDEKIVQVSEDTAIIYTYTKGTIRGIHFGEDDGEAAAPKAADILNPEAVKRFIALTHERYYEKLAPYFGNTIIGFFTDEPSALGRNTGGFREWGEGMETAIIGAKGRLEELVGLFVGEENETTKIYHRCIKKRLRETFYKPLSEWCKEHHIGLYGHPAESDDIEEQLYFQVPGQDLIMRRIRPLEGGIYEEDSVHGKLSADIARHLGRRRNANECFGVCSREDNPWHLTAADMKWYIDWLGIRGVNLYIPHAFYYSLTGERKNERPPDVGPNNIWWPYYRRFSDYMKRLSYLMTDSHNQGTIAVLCDNNRVPSRDISLLYENQIAFNYLPIAMLESCQVEGDKVVIGDYRYDTLINLNGYDLADVFEPVNTVTEVTQAFCNGYKNREGLRIIQGHKDLRLASLIKEGHHVYLFANEGAKGIEATIAIDRKSEMGTPIGFDLWKGEAYSLAHKSMDQEYYTYQLKVDPYEMQCVIMTHETALWGLGTDARDKESKKVIHWQEEFECIAEEDNKRIYTYTYICESGQKPIEQFVVEGEEMVECYCNDTFVDVSFWSPHRFDIGKYSQQGNNSIRLEVTGSAANLHGDGAVAYGLKRRL